MLTRINEKLAARIKKLEKDYTSPEIVKELMARIKELENSVRLESYQAAMKKIKELEEENEEENAKYAEDVLDMMDRHEKQLKEANKVIDYYGDGIKTSIADINYPYCNDYDICKGKFHYGKKAREYQAKYKGE